MSSTEKDGKLDKKLLMRKNNSKFDEKTKSEKNYFVQLPKSEGHDIYAVTRQFMEAFSLVLKHCRGAEYKPVQDEWEPTAVGSY